MKVFPVRYKLCENHFLGFYPTNTIALFEIRLALFEIRIYPLSITILKLHCMGACREQQYRM